MRNHLSGISKRAILIIAAATVIILRSATCATLCAAGTPYSFGQNSFGATGLGTTSGNALLPTPIDMSTLVGKFITQVAAGDNYSLLLDEDGTVYSFGTNATARTGLGVSSGSTLVATPIDTTNLSGKRFTQISASKFIREAHSLLLADDGTVFSFGLNRSGRTGLGTENDFALVATPINATNLGGRLISQVSAGGNHSLILAEDGTVFSFGSNAFGATGLGTTSGNTLIATPVDGAPFAGKRITQLAAGADHSLLLADDGTVFSFGSNHDGQTGVGISTGETLIPTPIDMSNLADKKISQVAAGEFYSLLLTDDGAVYSFGDNFSGRTGLGVSDGSTLVPTPIDTANLSGKRIIEIDAGFTHSLLLADDGTVFSFGANFGGATGLGSELSHTLVATAIQAPSLSGRAIIDVAAGSGHSLILTVPEPCTGVLSCTIAAQLLFVRRRTPRPLGQE